MMDRADSAGEGDRSGADLERLRQRLEAWRAEIAREICGYPPPIPACDQHYNHLLEQRREVTAALRRLEALRQADVFPEAERRALADLIPGPPR